MSSQITKRFAQIQIARLEAIPKCGFMTAGALRELIRVAMDCSDSEATLERAITQWLNDESRAPAPVDLVQLITAVRQDRASRYRPPDPNCRSCHGMGYELSTDHQGLVSARRCHCTKLPAQIPLSESARVSA
jgi:hypothetical protein